MKLIVGLGNPGEKYKETRHNVGFVVVDKLVSEKFDIQWSMVEKYRSLIINHQPSAIFCKPQTFMNSSGEAVSKLVNFYKIEINDLFVIHDDLDLKISEFKIQKGKGPRDHNGLISIYEKLGNRDFWHVRIGIENRTGSDERKIEGKEYVLNDFTKNERTMVEKTAQEVTDKLLKTV